jgi:hypothetical protein
LKQIITGLCGPWGSKIDATMGFVTAGKHDVHV